MQLFHRILMRISFMKEFVSLEGNQRICILMQPVWAIMYNLYAPYATLYMSQLGLSDVQIGLLSSMGMLLQMATALFGGVLIDKLGRNKATLIFDLLSWSLPCLLWSMAANFKWFFAAALFACFAPISSNAITSLLVEDCPPDKLVTTYALWSATGYVAAFFAPISMMLVNKHGVIDTMRILYFSMFVMITIKFISFYFLCHESSTGLRKIEQSRRLPLAVTLGGYGSLLRELLQTPQLRITLLLSILLNIAGVVSGNFFALYLTSSLGLPVQLVAVFPMAKSFIMLMVVFWLQRWLNCFNDYSVMLVGAGCYLLSHGCLLLSGQGGLWLLAVYTLCESLGQALLLPRKDTLITLKINKDERARVMALIHIFTMMIAVPFGYLGGAMAEISRSLPFVFTTGVYLICTICIFGSRSLRSMR